MDKGKGKATKPSQPRTEEESKLEDLAFKKPEDYEGMTEEEKEDLTRKMMGHWMGWAGKKIDMEAVDRRGVTDG